MKLATRLILLVGLVVEITALLVIKTHAINLIQLGFMLLMALPCALLVAFTCKATPLRKVHIVHLIAAILIAGVGVLVSVVLILFRNNWDIADPLLIVLLLLPIPQILTVFAGGIAGIVFRREAEKRAIQA